MTRIVARLLWFDTESRQLCFFKPARIQYKINNKTDCLVLFAYFYIDKTTILTHHAPRFYNTVIQISLVYQILTLR